ncbi:3-deoxy-D-manno-octulosonic acid kinase [Vibrio fortis]|uniref:3-deoxy-D-manno-octulosonic acid kinase n=1 Tax=Vibrio fortis TaxID=212667 RepID=UPI004067A8BA
MIKKIHASNSVIWFDEQLLDHPPESVFDIEYWQGQDRIIGSATGRGTTWFVDTGKLPAALRHYRRGGLFGKLVQDSYWFSGWDKTRSFMEMQLLNDLIEADVNVPKPIAARATKTGLSYRADLLSEKIAGATDLVDILTTTSVSADLYREIGHQIAKMHSVGVNHTDLNIHNILIDKHDRIWIIDFDKCGYGKGSSWKQSNLDRLKRSFFKELNKRQIHWQEEEFEALLAGYNDYSAK